MVASRSNVDLNYATPVSEAMHSPLLPAVYGADTMHEATLHRPYPSQFTPPPQYPSQRPQQYAPVGQHSPSPPRSFSPAPQQPYASPQRTYSPGPQQYYPQQQQQQQQQGQDYFGTHVRYPSQPGLSGSRMSPDSYAGHAPTPPPGLNDDGSPNMAGRGARRGL